jgi:micrococcal nuclease
MTEGVKQVSFRNYGAAKPLERNEGGPVAEWSCRGLQIRSESCDFNGLLQMRPVSRPRRINGLRGFCKTLAAVLSLASVGPALACDPVTPEAVTIVDGDTIRVGSERVRLLGYDTAELRSRCDHEHALAEQGAAFLGLLVETAGEMTLCRAGRDRYGRTLAALQIDGRDVAAIMVGSGLARAYDGGRREGWCR